MATYTFYGDTADGRVYGVNTDYPTARETASTADNTAVTNGPCIGQALVGANYQVEEGFIQFDTSSIPDSETVTSATLSLYYSVDEDDVTFDVQARIHDWGTTLTTADWVGASGLAAKTLVATNNTGGMVTNAYTAFTSETAFPANINKTGFTRLLLNSSRHAGAIIPTGSERVGIWFGDEGANKRPKLVVVTGTTPTIAITSPADASSTVDNTPDFVVSVTDPDASETLTVTLEIYSDSGLTTLVQTLTTTEPTPASAVSKTLTPTALTRNATYWWRAKVSDGTNTSAWTATRSFTLYYDNPTVVISAPADAASVTTGGPNLTVTWATSQAQSQAQATYRVEFLNDAGTTTYYDSGELSGTTTSLAVDLGANGVPTDTTDIKVRVTTTVTGAQSAATDTNAFDVLWGVVTCTVLEPDPSDVVTTTRVTVEWSFSSTRSKTQAHYRVRLLTASGVQLYDSGWVASTSATTYQVPIDLADNAHYQCGVQLKNNEGSVS